jgi:hypothetical protein
MGQILKLISNFKNLNVDAVIERSLTEVSPEIIGEQKDQLQHGQSSDGDPFPQYKNKSYAIKKNEINPLPGLGNPDLHLFGRFQDNIYVKIQNGTLFLSSTDSKTAKLGQQYGLDIIFGLAKQRKAKVVQEDLRPVFFRNIRNEVHL